MVETVKIDPAWLRPTWFIDFDDEAVSRFAEDAAGAGSNEVETARDLFYAVRDGFRYDPYETSHAPEAFRASAIVGTSANWCIPKSVLFVAAARHHGIPARLGFADVRNHLTSKKLSERMGSDVFAWHGYAELLLDGRWVKLSTAFNIELCERFGVKALEFDPIKGALMHPFDQHGNKHMEYIRQRGSFDDLPLTQILETFAQVYPQRPADGAAPDDSGWDPAFHG